MNFSRSLFYTAILSLGFSPNSPVSASENFSNELRTQIAGHAVTGWNQFLGKPVYNLPFLGDLTFSIDGVCSDNNSSAAITSQTPLNAKLCTHADPVVYKAIFNVDVSADFPKNQNIPLADFPQIYQSDGASKPLPNVKNANWYQPSNGSQNNNYQLKDWIKAEGKINYVCEKKRNYYELDAKHLIPGGLYTLWLFYFDQVNPPPPVGHGGLQPDLAFGGDSANVFVADMNGEISAKRLLNFCPQRWSKMEQYQPINLHLVYHPESQVYGTVAEQLLKPPHNGGPGVVAIPQLMFTFPAANE